MNVLDTLFLFDRLSLVMICLVGFVGLSIALYSARYLKGDRRQSLFYVQLGALILTVFAMVSADHIVCLWLLWGLSNMLLTRLMCHKPEWPAAQRAAALARKNFLLGFVCLGLALGILIYATGETSIAMILRHLPSQEWSLAAGLLIVISAMTQSAQWPFHRWLTSSLNSPTPVSAIMHAGLVNGGGFIVARFSHVFIHSPQILSLIFVLGVITALLGTLWKLMQSDVKRLMACSTMGQMGFMMAQCGLGLVPAAIAHLCWHGLFKAYLFLGSVSVAQEERFDVDASPKLSLLLLAIVFGAGGACVFALSSGKEIGVLNTNLFLALIAMIAGTQFALPILRIESSIRWPFCVLATTTIGAVYGYSIRLMEWLLEPLGISSPQPLNILHILALVAFAGAWMIMLFRQCVIDAVGHDKFLKTYVRMLNASQPHPDTVTTHRNHYHF